MVGPLPPGRLRRGRDLQPRGAHAVPAGLLPRGLGQLHRAGAGREPRHADLPWAGLHGASLGGRNGHLPRVAHLRRVRRRAGHLLLSRRGQGRGHLYAARDVRYANLVGLVRRWRGRSDGLHPCRLLEAFPQQRRHRHGEHGERPARDHGPDPRVDHGRDARLRGRRAAALPPRRERRPRDRRLRLPGGVPRRHQGVQRGGVPRGP
mmetsp:Transcript_124597/g.338470  ORF Transcript_124597/g.338470 Transcript_124597/m.338470 type:complete len:206 (+) Transcript_124597:889-1506(+)